MSIKNHLLYGSDVAATEAKVGREVWRERINQYDVEWAAGLRQSPSAGHDRL
jgi:hypothetical protein